MLMIRAILRASWISFGSFLGCVACLFYLWQNKSWLGEWQSSVQAVSTTLPLMLPGLILCAALDARRLMGSRSEPWPLTSANALRRHMAITAVLCLPAVSAVAVLLVTAAAASAAVSSFRNPGVPVLILLFLWPVVAVSLGVAMARWIPRIAIIAGSLILGFIVPVVFSTSVDAPLALLTPIDNGSVSPPQTFRQLVVVGQCLLLLGLVICLVCLMARRLRRLETLVGVAGLSIALCGILILHETGSTRRFVAQDEPGPRVCRSESIEVCVWSDHESVLAVASAAASRVAKALPDDWKSTPSGWMEEGLARPLDRQVFIVPSVNAELGELVEEMSDELTTRLYCGPNAGGFLGVRSSLPGEFVDRVVWLLVRAGAVPAQSTSAPLQKILDMPEMQQEQWWLSAEGTDANCR